MARFEIVNWVSIAGKWEDECAAEYDGREFTRLELQQQFIDFQNANEQMPDRAVTSNLLVILCFRGTLEPVYKKNQSRPSSFIVHWLDKDQPVDDSHVLSEVDLENIQTVVKHAIEEMLG